MPRLNGGQEPTGKCNQNLTGKTLNQTDFASFEITGRVDQGLLECEDTPHSGSKAAAKLGRSWTKLLFLSTTPQADFVLTKSLL